MTASPPFCGYCLLRHAMPGRDCCDTCDVAMRTPVRPLPPPDAPPDAAAVERTLDRVEPLPHRVDPGGYVALLVRTVRRFGGHARAVTAAVTFTPPEVPQPAAVTGPAPAVSMFSNDSRPRPLTTVGPARNADRTA